MSRMFRLLLAIGVVVATLPVFSSRPRWNRAQSRVWLPIRPCVDSSREGHGHQRRHTGDRDHGK